MYQAGVITITTRATARPRPTTLPSPNRCRRRVPGRQPCHLLAAARRRRRPVGGAGARDGPGGCCARGSTLAAPERHPAGHASATSAATTVVRPGDSLWTVAERLAPDDDPRPVVDALAEARHGAVLTPGETIRWDG